MIRVAIIDTGVNLEHPDLINKNILCKRIDAKGEASFLQGNSDQIGHGTIKFAESVTCSRVVCLALSFRNVQASFSPLEQNVVTLTDDEVIEHTRRIANITGIMCFSINQVDCIFDTIINYLN